MNNRTRANTLTALLAAIMLLANHSLLAGASDAPRLAGQPIVVVPGF